MTPVEAELRSLIATTGPVSVGRLMAIANRHYYASRNPLGAAGDFITAPEISQVFGELIGLWAAEVWDALGRPAPLSLVELGPGRGSLMADALRTSRIVPDFQAALRVHLVETSPTLRAAQARALEAHEVEISWHADIMELPEGPAIVIANEFFDALPVHHLVRTDEGWRERGVGLGEDGRLAFGIAPAAVPEEIVPETLRGAPPGSLIEVSIESRRVMQELASRIAAHGGAALLIDYGYGASAPGDTLQAVKAHRYADPLEALGEADLTAHVDFATLAAVAHAAGARAHGPISQREFLLALGLAERTAALKERASPVQAQALDAAAARLTDPAPTAMGTLFKAMAVTARTMNPPPAFPALPAAAS